MARKYAGREVAVLAEPGDVVFFAGHVLHRSRANRSSRSRRAFVGHYCNARSWVPWNSGQPFEGEAANDLHILARGTTHLPYAQPKFGTPCAALLSQAQRQHESLAAMRMIADMNNGLMGCGIADPTVDHDHKDEAKKDGGY